MKLPIPSPSTIWRTLRRRSSAVLMGLAAPLAAISVAICFAPPAAADEALTIDWHAGTLESALSSAERLQRPLFIYCWMEGSQHCQKLWAETLTTQAAARALSSFVCFSAKATEARGSELVHRYGVSVLPTMLVLRANGDADDAILGFIDLPTFQAEMQRVQSGSQTVQDLTRRARTSPDDLALRFQLARKLEHVGRTRESREQIDAIKAHDPDGQTVVGAQIAMYEVRDGILAKAADPNDLSKADLRPLYRHLAQVKPRAVLFEGWEWVAQTETARGNREQGRRALRSAWTHVAERSRLLWGARTVERFWNSRAELSRKDKAFALQVARRCSEDALAWWQQDPEGLAAAAETGALESPFEFDETPASFVAGQLISLARALSLNGKKRDAIAALRRSMELRPGSSEQSSLLALLEAR